jgi:hypothetical protein
LSFSADGLDAVGERDTMNHLRQVVMIIEQGSELRLTGLVGTPFVALRGHFVNLASLPWGALGAH